MNARCMASAPRNAETRMAATNVTVMRATPYKVITTLVLSVVSVCACNVKTYVLCKNVILIKVLNVYDISQDVHDQYKF